MERIHITTNKPKSIVDITDRVQERIVVDNGLCVLTLLHTSAALTTADLDPGTDLDMLDAFDEMVPQLDYRHPHDPSHVGDHIMSSIIGPSVSVPVASGAPVLGTWQRIVLVEFNGPRERTVAIRQVSSQ